MKSFAFFALAVLAASFVCAVEMPVVLKKTDVYAVSPENSVRLEGPVGQWLAQALKGVESRDPDMLAYPFKARKETKLWKSEFWGKWFTSAVWAYRYSHSQKLDKLLRYSAAQIIKTQDAKGAIKTVTPPWDLHEMPTVNSVTTDQSWDLWGRKYTLLGLLAEYERTGEAFVLEAACKHADCILESVGDGKKDICRIGPWFGLPSSSILEPMALLYQYTGCGRYLDFAKYIIRRQKESSWSFDVFERMRDGWVVTDVFPKPGDPKFPDYPGGGSKAYEAMSCFEGLLEMYRITGISDYLKASENMASSIRESETLITGSCGIHEKLKRSKYLQDLGTAEWQETCVTATLIKFSLQLLRLTGKPIYMSDIELAAYNALPSAQKPDSSWWCHNSPINGVRKAAIAQCRKGSGPWDDNTPKAPGEPDFKMHCCVASGPRGIFTIPKCAYMTFDGGAVVNIYENGSAKLPVRGGSVDLKIGGLEWGRNSLAEISVDAQTDSEFTLRLYIPDWSSNAKIWLNGERLSGDIRAGTYFDIARKWAKNDAVKIDLGAYVRLMNIPGNTDVLYLKYGPFVLSMDRRFEPDCAKGADVKMISADKVDASCVNVGGAKVAFDVKLKDGSTRRFINYSDAGATWAKDSEFFTMFKRRGPIKYRPLGSPYSAQ